MPTLTFRQTHHDERIGEPQHHSFHEPLNILDVLDHYEVEAISGIQPTTRAFFALWEAGERDTSQPAPGYVWVCPGCWAWQVECPIWLWHYFPDGGDLSAPVCAAAMALATEHRAECPALDMLAGLAGIPA